MTAGGDKDGWMRFRRYRWCTVSTVTRRRLRPVRTPTKFGWEPAHESAVLGENHSHNAGIGAGRLIELDCLAFPVALMIVVGHRNVGGE